MRGHPDEQEEALSRRRITKPEPVEPKPEPKIPHEQTLGTWLCEHDVPYIEIDQTTGARKMITRKNAIPNAESAKSCWYCGARKPDKPKLVWPAYMQNREEAKCLNSSSPSTADDSSS